jgi:hypothetical protein
VKNISSLVLTLLWIGGIVIAKGFWSTFFAIFIPPWGWYLVADLVLRKYGLL